MAVVILEDFSELRADVLGKLFVLVRFTGAGIEGAGVAVSGG